MGMGMPESMATTIITICLSVAGAIIGSYAITIWSRWRNQIPIIQIISWRNLISPRWKDKVWTSPTSQCLSCKHPLRARDILPIISYLRYKGRCRYCGVPIGRNTIILEGTGLLVGLLITILIWGRL